MNPRDLIQSLGLVYLESSPGSAGRLLHWFNDPETCSTLGVYDDEISRERIISKICLSRTAFYVAKRGAARENPQPVSKSK
jgi:hypothetical protein